MNMLFRTYSHDINFPPLCLFQIDESENRSGYRNIWHHLADSNTYIVFLLTFCNAIHCAHAHLIFHTLIGFDTHSKTLGETSNEKLVSIRLGVSPAPLKELDVCTRYGTNNALFSGPNYSGCGF